MSKLFSSKAKDFENEALEVHNEYRREHGVAPLVINNEISKFSQSWAEELAKKDSMSHSRHQNYGENVYCGWSSDPNAKIKARDCIKKWYNEINDYAFGREPDIRKCGHFTQIVWKNTKELGIGSAKSKTGKVYVVANYYPRGNYSGQFDQNVLPPGAHQIRLGYSRSTGANSKISPKLSGLVSKFGSTSISNEIFEDEFLRAHNEYRKQHGVPILELNKKLCKYAEEWASVLSKKGEMEHRDQHDYGENIFYAWSSNPNFAVSGRDPVDKWYSEIKIHRFGIEPSTLASGHFTQVVWEDTKEVGVGVASKDGHVYVVANYYPPGNVAGSFAKKVQPPIN